MEKTHVRLFAAVAVLCLCRAGWGQELEAISVKGEVQCGSPALFRGTVTLSDMRNRETVASSEIAGDGTFEFRHVPYGDYYITVSENGEQPIGDEMISVRGQNRPILLQVPPRKAANTPAGSVSAVQLLHPPAKKAVEASMAARRFADAGDYQKAAESLEKAVSISPLYVDAWTNLAVQHVRLGHYQQALDELSHAGEIGQPNAIILGNTASVQHILRRDGDAIRSARQALQIDASYAPAHFLLGMILASDRRTLPESITHLEFATRTIPAAQAFLDRARQGMEQPVSRP